MALPLLILCVIYAGPTLFAAMVSLISVLGLHEFYRMGLSDKCRFESMLSVLVGFFLSAGILLSANSPYLLFAPVASVFLVALIFLFRFQDIQEVGKDMAISMLGLAYVPLLLAHAGLLRMLPQGREWVVLVFFIVMSSDSLAYFVGRALGKRSLYKAVSPNKSIEGALGGLAGGLLGALIFKICFFNELNLADVVFLGIGVGVFSQLGDLVESLFKRTFGVKDSGTIIPGHGGVLDRLDSLLFAFPVTYYYAVLVCA